MDSTPEIFGSLEEKCAYYQNISQNIANELEEYKQFKLLVAKIAHDLCSPLLILSGLSHNCNQISGMERILLDESTSRIRGISERLLNQYMTDNDNDAETRPKKLSVQAAVTQIILEKQYEYQDLPIEFITEYCKDSLHAFIYIDSLAFSRMLSNLINNAVDALDKKPGTIWVRLAVKGNNVEIAITDEGIGMSEEVINKIMSHIRVTAGKVNGHGLGFLQIWETLHQCNGTLSIESSPNIRTTITISIPTDFARMDC